MFLRFVLLICKTLLYYKHKFLFNHASTVALQHNIPQNKLLIMLIMQHQSQAVLSGLSFLFL